MTLIGATIGQNIFVDELYLCFLTVIWYLCIILRNIKSFNTTQMPIIALFVFIFTRVSVFSYFRLNEDNPLELKPSVEKVYFVLFIEIIGFSLVQLQCLFGPLVFIEWKKEKSSCFYSLNELKSKVEDIDDPCIICCSSLSTSYKAPKEQNTPFLAKIKGIMVDCYDYSTLKKQKDYLMLACRHVFHTKCVIAWIKDKKECPVCKTIVKDI